MCHGRQGLSKSTDRQIDSVVGLYCRKEKDWIRDDEWTVQGEVEGGHREDDRGQ